MGKLFIWEFMALDGILESPEKWVSAYDSPEGWDFIKAQNLECDALLLGRMTYEAFITFWPSQTNNEFGFADHLNRIPKYVVSSTLKNATWNNTTILSGDVITAVNKLKQQYTNVGLTGSPTLAQTLIQHDLIDEYRLMLYPIALGTGSDMRLFQQGSQTKLKLVDTKPFSSGVLGLTYRTDRG